MRSPRLIHLGLMVGIVGFTVIHLVLVVLFPRTLVSMVVSTPAEEHFMKRVIDPAGVRAEIRSLERRRLIRAGLSLGSLGLLTGCDLSTQTGVDAALWAMMHIDDRVQAWLFDKDRLAPTFAAAEITQPYRFNAFYEDWQVRPVPTDWKLAVSGRVAEKAGWTVEQLRTMPQAEQITRHICIEGWSQIGQWSGVPLGAFLQRVGADLTAPYVSFKCFDGYSTSIDMASALQPQTILALDFLGQAVDAGVGRAGPAAHPGQARVQERQKRRGDRSHGSARRQGRLLGRPGLQLVFGVVALGRAG